MRIALPVSDITESYVLASAGGFGALERPAFNRIAYAAGHVVSDPRRDVAPWQSPAIDWDATMRFRHHLWSHGFMVAEAMDTAQRGFGLDWKGAQELIRRSLAEARTVPGVDLACGISTDNLPGNRASSLDEVVAAYLEQLEFVEKEGGRTVMMASRALASVARSPDDYAQVYERVLSQASKPVILHWLGEAFDPALAGYWGKPDFDGALDVVLGIINDHPGRVQGIKMSLLDEAKEKQLRARLPDGALCFTGDDFNYPRLIEGEDGAYSHALLGIFDAIAPVAAHALQALAAGDTAKYRGLMEPTVPLARTIFEAPTQYYKAGVVFLAWLNGHQDHFIMPAGMQSARGINHYSQIFRQADAAGVLARPDLAIERMQQLLRIHGL